MRKGEAGGWRQYFTEVFQLDWFLNKYPIIQLLISDIKHDSFRKWKRTLILGFKSRNVI